jgi:hypothetical protein
MKVGKKETLGRGEVVAVELEHPTGSVERSEDEVRFVCEVRPALQFESLLETMFNLATDGKTNRKGIPNPFRPAMIARAHFDTVRLPQPPAWIQRAGLALGALLGRALGYRPTYAPEVTAPVVPAVWDAAALLLHAAGARADPSGLAGVRSESREARSRAGSAVRMMELDVSPLWRDLQKLS